MNIDLTAEVRTNKQFRKNVLKRNEADLMKLCSITLADAKLLKQEAARAELK